MNTEMEFYRNAMIQLMALEDEMIGAGMPMEAVVKIREAIAICRADYHKRFDAEEDHR